MLTTAFVPLPIIAAADDGTVVGAFTVTGGTLDEDYSYADNVLTISTDTALTIANTDPSTATTTDKIVVASTTGANIMLAGVNIDVSATNYACAFMISNTVTGKATITLADGSENTLKSGRYCAGLQKNSGDSCNLTINGKGKLTAKGGYSGAGIGGESHKAGENITITGNALVIAKGGSNGAGIGGGSYADGKDITVSGSAAVSATGGEYGAGIGSGMGSNFVPVSGENITITDNAVVTATGGKLSAGIGGGHGMGSNTASSSSNIQIKGGSVNAIAGTNYNVNIGTDPTNGTDNVYLLKAIITRGEKITIDDVTYSTEAFVTMDFEPMFCAYLTGGNHTIKLGDPDNPTVTKTYKFVEDTKNFMIESSTGKELAIKAKDGSTLTENTDYTYTDGILTILTNKAVTISGATTSDRVAVNSSSGADITLDVLYIDVSNNSTCAFEIKNGCGNVVITLADRSQNQLISGSGYAGLQKSGVSNTLEITGTGNLTATGGYEAAGIGGGYYGEGSNITISGGTIIAKGGYCGAGIGGGYSGAGSIIAIKGSAVVTATGGYNGAGIGGGRKKDGSNIKITGGSVNAKSTSGSAIGGGLGSTNGAVTPTDGTNDVYLCKMYIPYKSESAQTFTINGISYPTSHLNESYIYAYLPKTDFENSHNAVWVIDSERTINYGYYYDETHGNWKKTVSIPTHNDEPYVYNGKNITYFPSKPTYILKIISCQIASIRTQAHIM